MKNKRKKKEEKIPKETRETYLRTGRKNGTMKEGSLWRPREGKYGDVTGGVGSPTVQPIFA